MLLAHWSGTARLSAPGGLAKTRRSRASERSVSREHRVSRNAQPSRLRPLKKRFRRPALIEFGRTGRLACRKNTERIGRPRYVLMSCGDRTTGMIDWVGVPIDNRVTELERALNSTCKSKQVARTLASRSCGQFVASGRRVECSFTSAPNLIPFGLSLMSETHLVRITHSLPDSGSDLLRLQVKTDKKRPVVIANPQFDQ